MKKSPWTWVNWLIFIEYLIAILCTSISAMLLYRQGHFIAGSINVFICIYLWDSMARQYTQFRFHQ